MSEDWESVRKWLHLKEVVSEDLSIKEAAKAMVKRNIGSVIVSSRGEEIGMLTERDILSKVVARGLDGSRVKVRGIMTTPLVTINDKATIWEAAELMAKHKIRRLSVTDEEGVIIGLVTTYSISNALPIISRLKESTKLKTSLWKMKHKE